MSRIIYCMLRIGLLMTRGELTNNEFVDQWKIRMSFAWASDKCVFSAISLRPDLTRTFVALSVTFDLSISSWYAASSATWAQRTRLYTHSCIKRWPNTFMGWRSWASGAFVMIHITWNSLCSLKSIDLISICFNSLRCKIIIRWYGFWVFVLL